MGICTTKDLTEEEQQAKNDKKISKAIDKDLRKDEREDKQMNKLLLLGAGASGKSTLFKQMHILYIGGYNDEEREKFIPAVYSNVIVSIQALCENSDAFAKEDDEFKVGENLQKTKAEICALEEEAMLTPEIATNISALLEDPGIKLTYKNRSKFQLSDSTDYFFEKLAEIAKPDYVPTEQDVLRTRVPTTGIVENEFDIEGNIFRMFDVGGQRSERKKWIHCFENVTAVLFVAAISAYNQVLYEDEKTNRMVESLTLFESISENDFFNNTAMILFLNKKDIFADKLKEFPLEDHFPEFQPTNSNKEKDEEQQLEYYGEAEEYLTLLFEEKREVVYTHVTVATDSNNIFIVFQAVKDIVIKKGLERAGLT